jgi:hypothetical protein
MRVRIISCSTSAKPPKTAIIKRPALVPVSRPRLRERPELRLRVHEVLDMKRQCVTSEDHAI